MCCSILILSALRKINCNENTDLVEAEEMAQQEGTSTHLGERPEGLSDSTHPSTASRYA